MHVVKKGAALVEEKTSELEAVEKREESLNSAEIIEAVAREAKKVASSTAQVRKEVTSVVEKGEASLTVDNVKDLFDIADRVDASKTASPLIPDKAQPHLLLFC